MNRTYKKLGGSNQVNNLAFLMDYIFYLILY